MTKTKKTVFHKGDRVRIINPEIFIRCGYPMTIEDEVNRLRKEHTDTLREMLTKLGMNGSYDVGIYKAIAYASCKQKEFGGRERKIYTYQRPDLKDVVGEVYDKQNVKTGYYQPAWGTYEDYDPAHLRNPQTHVILHISTENSQKPWDIFMGMIEAKNVEKVLNHV